MKWREWFWQIVTVSALEWPRRYLLIYMFHHTRQRLFCYPAIMPNCNVDCSWSSSTQSCSGCYLLCCSIDDLGSLTKRLSSPGTMLLVLHSSGPCPNAHGCFKAFKAVSIIEFWKVYLQFKCFTIDPNSVTKSCSVIKKPLGKRLGELWLSTLLSNRKSLKKVQKTLNTLVDPLLYMWGLDDIQ